LLCKDPRDAQGRPPGPRSFLVIRTLLRKDPRDPQGASSP